MIACTLKFAAGQNKLSIIQPHIMRTCAVMVVDVPAVIEVPAAGSVNSVNKPGITITTAIAPVSGTSGKTIRLHVAENRESSIEVATKVRTVGSAKGISAVNSVA